MPSSSGSQEPPADPFHTPLTPETRARLRAYAHELAEKIRAVQVTPSWDPSYDDGKEAGLNSAADLLEGEEPQ